MCSPKQKGIHHQSLVLLEESNAFQEHHNGIILKITLYKYHFEYVISKRNATPRIRKECRIVYFSGDAAASDMDWVEFKLMVFYVKP